MSVPYLGARISLVSKSEVRYEGILYNINTHESTVALHNVKAFGTEGRRLDGPQIPPNPELFEYVIFRGNDIKELEVCEAAPTVAAVPAFEDPAIVASKSTNSTAAPPAPPPHSAPSHRPNVIDRRNGSGGVKGDANAHAGQQQTGQQMYQQQQQQQQRNGWNHGGRGARRGVPSRGGVSSRGGAVPGMGTHLLHKRTRNNTAAAAAASGLSSPAEGAFDFAGMNSKFDKQGERAKLTDDSNGASGNGLAGSDGPGDNEADVADEFTPAYSKSSFFDTISCDMTDKEQGKNSRLFGAQERTLNQATFGAAGLSHDYGQSRGRGRGRGGYRGHRGRGGRIRGAFVHRPYNGNPDSYGGSYGNNGGSAFAQGQGQQGSAFNRNTSNVRRYNNGGNNENNGSSSSSKGNSGSSGFVAGAAPVYRSSFAPSP